MQCIFIAEVNGCECPSLIGKKQYDTVRAQTLQRKLLVKRVYTYIFLQLLEKRLHEESLWTIASADDDDDHVIRVRSFASLEQAIKKAAYVEVGKWYIPPNNFQLRLPYMQ